MFVVFTTVVLQILVVCQACTPAVCFVLTFQRDGLPPSFRVKDEHRSSMLFLPSYNKAN